MKLLVFLCVFFMFSFFGIWLGTRLFSSKTDDGKKKKIKYYDPLCASFILAIIAVGVPTLASDYAGAWYTAPIIVLAYVLVLGALIGLVSMFIHEGSNLVEFAIATAITVILFVIGYFVVGGSWCSIIASEFTRSVVLFVMVAALIVAIATCLISLLLFRSSITGKDIFSFLALVVSVIAGVILLGFMLGMIKWNDLRPATVAAQTETTPAVETKSEPQVPEVEPEEKKEPFYTFYNLALQDNGDEDDDFNFGPDSYGIETNLEKDAEFFDSEFRSRLKKDPALLAGDAAFLDSVVGTRYMGVFYEGAKNDWATAINDAKVTWMNDEELFKASNKAFEEFLDTARSVEVLVSDGKETDMMYMNPYTIDGAPDVIVMKTDNHKGHYLVYTFEIKGQIFKVAYRIECGFQPTNVSERMKIPVTPKPKKPNNPPDNPPDNPPGDPPKDKNQGTQGPVVGPNDDPSPGPDTNNPDDPNHSTKDDKPSSTDDDYDGYKDDLEDNEDANEPKPEPEYTPEGKPDHTDEGDLDNKPKDPVPEQETENTPDNPGGDDWGAPPD